MNKKTMIFFAAFAALMCVSDGLFANKMGSVDLSSDTKALQSFLFGAPMQIIALFGAVASFARGVMGGGWVPMATFGAVGLGTTIIPTFINGLFVSTMLLP